MDKDNPLCPICCKHLDDNPTKVYEKGLQALLKCSELRDDKQLHELFHSCSSKPEKVKLLLHKECRKRYTDPKLVNKAQIDCNEGDVFLGPSPKKLRSSLPLFNWKEDCFLCCEKAFIDNKHPERNPISLVRTLNVRDKILEQCELINNSYAKEVATRVNGCLCLVAAEARYHQQCYRMFIRKEDTDLTVPGRPLDDQMQTHFLALCDWLENKAFAELYTLEDLMAKMTTLAAGGEVYSNKSLRAKLKEYYGDHIFFARIGGGEKDVLCFRDMANYIVNKTWYVDKCTDLQRELERIMITCAKLIKEEIRGHEYSRTHYPNVEDIKNHLSTEAFLTPCLKVLLKNLIGEELKQNAIGQMIIQAARPNTVLCPLMFGLGVELDFVFGSKWLLQELASLGMSVNYDEVRRFKQSVLQNDDSNSVMLPPAPTFTQWSADNADSTVATLTGSGQFHGIGMCAMTAVSKLPTSNERIPRMSRVPVSELIENKGVTFRRYFGPACPALSKLKFEPILNIIQTHINQDTSYYSNILWQTARRLSNKPVPNWSGYMEQVFRVNSAEKWEVLILPFIDLNPNDESSLYTCLKYIEDQGNKMNLPCFALTFDQPLWLKATEIVEAQNLTKFVIRLGGFHLLMSALGAALHIMKGSGIEDAFKEVYGENVVNHILSGKAYSRAIRANTLVESALMTKLTSMVLPNNVNDTDEAEETLPNDDNGFGKESYPNLEIEQIRLLPDEFSDIRRLIAIVLDDSSTDSLDKIINSQSLHKLSVCLSDLKSKLSSRSRTAKLWIQYLYHVNCIKQFIYAERTSDWEGHLHAVGKLLNVFAAARHIHYAKSARLYLQRMRQLPERNPWLYEKFSVQGLHAVRRSAKFWAGLSTDLVIEQVVMRTLKSRGGLTHGRGLTESVRQQWVFTMHQFASIHEAMTCVTGRQHETSEQHQELGKTRTDCDTAHYVKILNWFNVHDPFFTGSPELRSISSGLTASEDDGINCDNAERIGANIHNTITGQSIHNAKMKKNNAVRNLQELQPGVKINNKVIHIDPSVLFMRCIALAERLDTDIVQYFSHELSPVPSSLFKDSFMRKANKSDLAIALQKKLESFDIMVAKDSFHVIDGGWLLHQVKWRNGASYCDVAEDYRLFLEASYGLCCVVFDGYVAAYSTKDHEHLRRSGGKRSADILFRINDTVPSDSNAFLSNQKNKSAFLKLLAEYLTHHKHKVIECDDDADVAIVHTSLKYAGNNQNVTVVAEDTDIFVLLVYHWKPGMAEIFLRKKARTTTKKGCLYKMSNAYESLDPVIVLNLLFLHAWSGCDTTSLTYGQGKSTVLKMLPKLDNLQAEAKVIAAVDSDQKSVGDSGIKIFSLLYGSNCEERLSALRYKKYQSMLASCKSIQPERLPPTSRAAYFHSLRVHLQILQWDKLDNKYLDPLSWGWKRENERLWPIMTDQQPAPESVLNFIRCKCKSLRNQCANNLCSCRKNFVKCVAACSGCRGESCQNCETQPFLHEADDEETPH